ncbi:unnamed protein product [Effrenium voratum]|uniref:Uncharacterized protein n=1 Tax=Effrenium voratum TaxID=2562239 RepID=A0AA36NI04_9DINO|nr:unnamed protein product [Effrenium voratum]
MWTWARQKVIGTLGRSKNAAKTQAPEASAQVPRHMLLTLTCKTQGKTGCLSMWPVSSIPSSPDAGTKFRAYPDHPGICPGQASQMHFVARVTSPRHTSATLRAAGRVVAKPGEITLACWQHFECVASSISRVRGVYHLKDVVARAPDMLQGVAL